MKPLTQRALLATAVWAAVSAQTASAQLEEVLVTAERREANLQDTPISITTFSDQEIIDRGINSADDLITQVAGVYGYTPPGSAGSPGFNIRGIGDGASTNLSLDTAVAKYIDGVYLGKGQGSGVDMIDLARIEILKGPQGTLFGRNSTGGTLNFITKAPGTEFSADLRASVGDYDYGAFSGRIDVPLGDKIGMSASFYSREREEFWDGASEGKAGAQDLDREGFRVAFQVRPVDRWTFDYSHAEDELNELDPMIDVNGFNPAIALVQPGVYQGDYARVPTDSASRAQGIGGIAYFVANFLPPPVLQVPQVGQFLGWANDFVNWSAGELADKGNVPSNAYKDGVAFTETETVTDTFRATWEINDSLELRYIFGHRTVEVDTSSDLDGMDNSAIGGIQGELQLQTIGGALLGGVVPPAIPIPGLGLLPLDPSYNFQLALDMVDTINDFGRAPIFDTVSNADYKQTSHEFQLVGSTGTVDWATGVFFFDDSSEWRNIASPTFPLAASYSRSADHDTKATSVFGEATWRPSGTNWAFTAGLRYTDEEKEITYLWRDAAPGSAGIAGYIGVAIQETISALMGNPVDIPFDLGAGYYWDLADLEKIPETPGVYGQSFSNDFSDVSGRLVAQYYFSDDINVYASFSTGYRAGGFNDGYFNRQTGTPDDFTEENMESWEIGIKSMLLDGRVRFNATYFNYEYSDMQVSTIDTTGGNLAQQTDNAAEASRDGFEIDAAWAVTPSLRLKATYAFIDGDFDEFPDFLGLDVRAQPGMLPESSATFVMDWDLIKAGNGTLNLQLVANYQDEAVSIATTQGAYVSAAYPTPVPVAFDQEVNQSRTLVDARLSWLHEMDNGQALSIALWGRNITDEEYRSFSFNFGPDLGLSLGQWGAPATYGVDLRYQF